ncbi:hypothetical protein Btru_057052 [Bulinus truncatus]|nr:hypothetical protein Btru_057052 [Bulinus truncatus]
MLQPSTNNDAESPKEFQLIDIDDVRASDADYQHNPNMASDILTDRESYRESHQDTKQCFLSDTGHSNNPASTVSDTNGNNVREVEQTNLMSSIGQGKVEYFQNKLMRNPLQRQLEVYDSNGMSADASLSIKENPKAAKSGLLDPKNKLNKSDHRCCSLEVPSITIKVEDAAEEDAHTRHYSTSDVSTVVRDIRSLTSYAEFLSQSDQRAQYYLCPSGQTPLHLSSSERNLVTRSVGRASGNRLKTCYSLDASGEEETGQRNKSRSMSMLVTKNGQLTQKQRTVEDKLIGSSMIRLEKIARDRRSSWATGNMKSVQGKEGQYSEFLNFVSGQILPAAQS